MKKLFTIILLALLCLNAMAYDFSAVCSTGQTLYYSITSNVEPYTVEIVPENESSPYYNVNPSGGLEMPETVEYNSITYSVAGIGNYAFRGCSGLTSVAIPNSVTSIGDDAFYECSGLLAVYFTGDIEQWCGIVFEGYSSNPLMYAHNLYFNDELLTDLVIPNTVTQVKAFAFYYATCITSITIGSSVSIIGNSAFERCTELTGDLILPNSLISIGIAAFRDCSGLTGELNIPDLVTDIGKNAFNTCTGFTGALIIPNSVASIGEMAFRYCRFTSVVIGNSVTSIGRIAFDSCEELTSVTIGRSVDTISEYAFDVCENITDIYILANTPPIIDNSNAFTSTTYSTATLWTPCGLTDTYGAATNWSSFTNIQERFLYELNVSSSNEQYGTASIRQQPDCTDAIAVIEATPNQGYQFVSWNDGNAENPRIITVTSDSTFVATFRSYSEIVCDNPCPAVTDQPMSETAIPYYATEELVFNIGEDVDVCITIKCPETINVEFMGTPAEATITDMTITEFLNLPDGLSYCVSLVDMNPTTNNYATLHITGVPTATGDFNLDISCNVTGTANVMGNNVPLSNQAITFDPGIDFIILEQGIKLIRVLSNNDAYGSVYGGGTYDEGSTATISATPYEGYRFVQWNDGNYDNPRTITVTSHITYEAVFEGTNDLGVVSINSPVSGCGLSSENIRITIKNYGVFQQSYIVKYSVDGGINWTEETVNSSIDAGVTTDYTFNATLDMSAVGTYNIIAKTALVGDEDASNDEAERIVVSQGLYDSSNSYTDFNDADEDDFVNDWYTDGTNSSWAFGKTAVSQNDSIWTWATNPNGLVNPDEESFLYSPCYDLSGMENPIIKIKLNYNLNAMDIGSVGAYLSLYWSHDGSPAWSLIDPGDVNEGWYPPGLASDTTTPGWSGNTNGFVTVRTNLLMPTSIDRTNIKFRFAFVTDNVNSGENEEIFINGAAINSFVIYDCPSIPSASFTTSEPLCTGQPIQFTNNSQNAESSAWNFGDGTGIDLGETIGEEGFDLSQFFGDGSTTSTDENPTMTYQTAGEYGVTLVVTNECGSSSHWESLIVNSCTNTYTIIVLSNNDAYGFVSDGGTFEEGVVFEIAAMPNDGYRFVSWNDGNTENPRTITVTSDSTFVANFEANIYTITVLSNNDAYGMVSGGGTYEEGSTATISATPYQGYRFVQWNDGSTDNPRTITVTSDSTFVANFEAEQAQQYTITVLSSNEAYGSVSGSGTYYEGDTLAIFAMPNDGYNFVSWNDGDESSPRTIVVTSDSTFIADFVKCEITYSIDTVVNNFVTVGDHTFYSTGNYTFAVSHETACDTIYDINLTVLAEPVYDIGPNPTKSLLNINSDGFISAVEFYTTTGQLVLRKEVNGYEAEFDVEGLVDGVYILRIYGEESNLPSVTKIIKE